MSNQSATRQPDAADNGIDVKALHATVGAIQRDRTLARFEFRATNQWLGGTMNRSKIQGFFGAGAEQPAGYVPPSN